MQKHRIV